MEYKSREEAQKNYHSLKVGDTFIGTSCKRCGGEIIGYYLASGYLTDNSTHSLVECFNFLVDRVEKLEKKLL